MKQKEIWPWRILCSPRKFELRNVDRRRCLRRRRTEDCVRGLLTSTLLRSSWPPYLQLPGLTWPNLPRRQGRKPAA